MSELAPEVEIRPETGGDQEAVFAVTQEAFKTQPHASGTEGHIINRLREKGSLCLSLVADMQGKVVGQVSFSPVELSGGGNGWYGLGPVAVRPELHGRGIGGALIREGLLRLRQQNARGCILVGDPGYYHRFGFTARPGLTMPDVPPDVLLALSFTTEEPLGRITFDPAFFE